MKIPKGINGIIKILNGTSAEIKAP